MNLIANYRAGRVFLHIVAAIGDHQIRFHLAGIAREIH